MTVSLSTQILIFAIALLLFISVSVPYEYVTLPDVYILLSPHEEEVHSSSSGNRCIHLSGHLSKRLNPLSIIILACLCNTQKNKTERQTASSLVLIWIGPISSITSSNVYTKRINNTTQTRNSTVLWWLLWYQVTLYNSNIFGISINASEQSFPNYVLKISGYIFWLRLLWLKIIKSYTKSPILKSVN